MSPLPRYQHVTVDLGGRRGLDVVAKVKEAIYFDGGGSGEAIQAFEREARAAAGHEELVEVCRRWVRVR